MSWFRRARRQEATPPGGYPDAAAEDAFATRDEDALLAFAGIALGVVDEVFACSTCGRTDLPPAGDWDPPICSECDAAINFDAILEAEFLHEH